MNRFSFFIRQALASVLIFLLSACAEEPLSDNQIGEGDFTVTLRIGATIAPLPETKATALPAHSDSEAAGFKYEMVSSDADRAATTPGFSIKPMPPREENTDVHFVTKALATRAPSVLKNAYGLLFMSNGAFNGRAPIGAYTVGTPQDVTFTKVVNPKADGCRLVIVANNDAAGTSYASNAGTGNFAGFSGTYAEFQQLTITNEVSNDEDVPYAGNATVDLSQSEIGVTADVTLSWTLAKITLNNHTFEITGGPKRSSITLYNAGVGHFAPATGNSYEGTGSTPTTAFVPNTGSDNSNSVTWYVGENIQSPVTGIKNPADRNSSKAPKNGCYIRVASATLPIPKNITPKIGEEYMLGGTRSFTYDYYLGKSSDVTDFALRRHTTYSLSSEISGTLAEQEEIAAIDGRVTQTRPEPAGLAIGCFGGPAGYATGGIGEATKTKGTYTKLLLLEPNTSRSLATDNVFKKWGKLGTYYQRDSRRYWDWTYIYSITTDGTIGGMSTAADGLYAYCNELTLGDVPKGTWYVPTEAQMQSIYTIRGGMKEGRFGEYSAFTDQNSYWCSTEASENQAWFVLNDCGTFYKSKDIESPVRCVRDALATETTGHTTEVNGYPAIDLSALSPLGCVLTSAEAIARCQEINSQTPSNTALLPVGLGTSGIYGTWNAKMSSRFQVMRKDLLFPDWASAYDGCKNYEGETGKAGQWRLPTQRELLMLWVLHPQLVGKGGMDAFTPLNYYCCNTEQNAKYAWQITFQNGNIYFSGYSKTVPFNVRCVRDLM